jgi:carbon-monoxide dehydrogenase large subunit
MLAERAAPQFIGARVKRREDPRLVTGHGQYVADVDLPGALQMVIVRSPAAHATLQGVDFAAALAEPGVVATFTAADIADDLAAPLAMTAPEEGCDVFNVPQRWPLAIDRVRYVGEPVAVILAETAGAAAAALELAVVELDELPAAVERATAQEADAPKLFAEAPSNLALRWRHVHGDVDTAFANAPVVSELSMVNQRLVYTALEPRAAAAVVDPAGVCTLWSTTQIPHAQLDDIVTTLGLSTDELTVIAPDVGGGFGAKCNSYAEDVLAVWLARRLGRPIRWTATRSEEFVATFHGRARIDTLRLAADRQGRIQAIDFQSLADLGGAASRQGPAVPPLSGLVYTGVYDIPTARACVDCVYTNTVPVDAYRGAGRPEITSLIERAVDVLATELQMDPAELRRRNLIQPEQFPYTAASGTTYDSGDYPTALARALAAADYKGLRAEQARRQADPDAALLGIGLSSYTEICGFGPDEYGSVSVDADGQVTVLTGSASQGQGHATSWAQIAADTLHVPLDDIRVIASNTAQVPRGVGTYGSRSAPAGGMAVLEQATIVRDRALELAAAEFEASVEDMVLVAGRFHVRGVPARALSWGDVAAAAGDALSSDGDYEVRGETFPFGTHVCVVEVDRDTAQPRVVGYWTVDDCGPVINPLLADGQVCGGIVQGIGQALFEGAVYDAASGQLLNGSLIDYAVPKAHQLPALQTDRTVTPTPFNALGIKGIGEAATIGSTPAAHNAVVDAVAHLGVRHIDMPLTAEAVWRAITAAADV